MKQARIEFLCSFLALEQLYTIERPSEKKGALPGRIGLNFLSLSFIFVKHWNGINGNGIKCVVLFNLQISIFKKKANKKQKKRRTK